MTPTRVVVEIEGAFDASAARVIRAAFVRHLRDFTIDFSHARSVDDLGLALLAQPSARVTIVGLSRHHERLLRYLGAPAPPGAGPPK